MCTPIAPWQAPGPRVTIAAAGRPVSLPYASAMFTAPASNRQVTSFNFCRDVVEAVERIEEGFARHGEHMVDALRDQRIRQNAAARCAA